MKKVIYLEGETELAFVYQLLMTHYDEEWTRFRMQIILLDPRARMNLPSDYGLEDAPDEFLLICTGSDESVISKINENARRHLEAGYEIVVGLKDVYGERYIKSTGHRINQRKITELICAQRDALDCNKSALYFAIMEVEAWILGLQSFLQREFPGIELPYENDPQEEICHPFAKLRQALNAVNIPYDKHIDEVLSLVSKIKKEDFVELYTSSLCVSFKEFYDCLFKKVEAK